MAISVKPITLWRRELQDRPGALAESLAPFEDAGAGLTVVMAYRYPGDPGRAAVELFPVTGKRAIAAAERGGFSEANIPALLVEGDDAPGLGHRLSRAAADAGINLDFVVAQVIRGRFSAVFGFAQQEDAQRAIPLFKKSAPRAARPAARKKSAGGKTPAARKRSRR
jgi:predicted amino acid-binding ACT domain protein